MIRLRDLNPGDGDVLDELLAGMSPNSRYLRFHTAVPVLTPPLRRALLGVHARDHIALLAYAGGRVVGIARLIRTGPRPDEAEIAVAVADRWHRRGIARTLCESLIERAGAVGIHRVRAAILSSNEPALQLFRTVFPMHLTRRHDGVVDLVGLLENTFDWEITMEDVMDDLSSGSRR